MFHVWHTLVIVGLCILAFILGYRRAQKRYRSIIEDYEEELKRTTYKRKNKTRSSHFART